MLEKVIMAAQLAMQENAELTLHICKEGIGVVVRWDCENFPDTTAECSTDVQHLDEAIRDCMKAVEEMVSDRIKRSEATP